MREESIPISQIRDLAGRVAALQKRAGQQKVVLPIDAALYIAQNVGSNASAWAGGALEGPLTGVLTHSSVTGIEITLKYTQQVLARFIAAEARKVDVDLPQKRLSLPLGTKEAKIRPQDPTAADRDFVLCLLGTRDERKSTRVRLELQVNMRESERDRLARRDGYERELERRARKRKPA